MWNEDCARKLNTRVVLAVLETLLQSQTGWLNCSDKPILVVEFPVCVFLENAVEVFFEEVRYCEIVGFNRLISFSFLRVPRQSVNKMEELREIGWM